MTTIYQHDNPTTWDNGRPSPRWETVCRLDRLLPGRGVAALLGNRQIALFRVVDQHREVVYAIDNLDPCSGAAVLSRGIVGDRAGEPVVASPLYKQSFSLLDGRCLDEPDHRVTVYPVRLSGTDSAWVQVELP